MSPKVYIIILNWNGWKDTIECLESVFRLDYDNYQVIICDNASEDNSVDHIQAWAKGKEPVTINNKSALISLTTPAIKKPISSILLGRKQAEDGKTVIKNKVDLIVIETGANLGFAGGNNVGLRYALKQDDVDFIWLLNNDTVVEENCLQNMINYSESLSVPNICGSLILFYDNPEIIQALGGNHYNKWTGIASTTLGRGKSIHDEIAHKDFERQLSYIMGASWLLPRAFLYDTGLMEESYFLYNEEIDWCVRNNGKYKLCYAADAKVYHKEGSSIGSPSGERPSSLLADFYLFRNKLRFTRRHYPYALFTVYFATLLQGFNRARRGQWDKAKLIFQILLGKTTFNDTDQII